MNGMCMECVWNVRDLFDEYDRNSMEYVLNMYGMCMEYAYNMQGTCYEMRMEYASNIHGTCME